MAERSVEMQATSSQSTQLSTSNYETQPTTTKQEDPRENVLRESNLQDQAGQAPSNNEKQTKPREESTPKEETQVWQEETNEREEPPEVQAQSAQNRPRRERPMKVSR